MTLKQQAPDPIFQVFVVWSVTESNYPPAVARVTRAEKARLTPPRLPKEES